MSDTADILAGFEALVQGLAQAKQERWAFWQLAVGPEIAEMTEPKAINHGTLVVGCKGSAVARFELHRLRFEIMELVNKHLPEGKKIGKVVFR